MSSSLEARSIARASKRSALFFALVTMAAIWAGIYLPGLGTLQLQHEEPRRALPALHMLASGDWLVPRVGSDPYLRKPPLLNWLIAVSCKLSARPSEWAIRLPSVLATLALAITILVMAGNHWLGYEGALVAATFFLANFTMVETGRLAELEAVYVCFTGIALVLWMTSWQRGSGPWRLWLLPAAFLAFGMLTKGPTHLIFFYGVVVPVLVFGKQTRLLRHRAHFVSLTIIVVPLLCWAIPCSLSVSRHEPMAVWRFWWDQLASRASAESDQHFRVSRWLLNGPQTLKNFLPWTLLLPLLWRKSVVSRILIVDEAFRDCALFRGARWGMVATSVLMVLLPNGSPRYIYPLIVVPCLLLGRALTTDYGSAVPVWLLLAWRRVNLLLLMLVSVAIVVTPLFAPSDFWTAFWIFSGAALAVGLWSINIIKGSQALLYPFGDGHRATTPAITSAGIAAIGMMVFAASVIPKMGSANNRHGRQVAAEIRASLPAGTPLWVLEYSYRPFWYYLEPDVRYFHRLADLPAEAHYFLVPATQSKALLKNPSGHAIAPTLLKQVVDNENQRFDLFARNP